MQLDGSFGLPELGPGKEFQAQVEHGRIETSDGVFETELMLGGDGLATLQEPVEELLHDAGVAFGVGIGQGRALHGRQSQMIKLGLLSSQGGLDVAQAILAGGLGIEEHGELVPSREFLDVMVSAKVRNGLVELMSGQKRQQLAHDCVRMHVESPPSVVFGSLAKPFYQ